MNAGETLLRTLVRCEDQDTPLDAGFLARRLYGDTVDGRRVINGLKALEHAGLAARRQGVGLSLWASTARGREVDAIMDRISAERGGQFAPMSHSGISASEANALQWGARSVPILPAGGTGAYA